MAKDGEWQEPPVVIDGYFSDNPYQPIYRFRRNLVMDDETCRLLNEYGDTDESRVLPPRPGQGPHHRARDRSSGYQPPGAV